ncbi:hypothetical protein KEM55_005824 [Ascosphaera atra]|nr:hypothetical protein KEM55_005824 [Ascosphaera atra]
MFHRFNETFTIEFDSVSELMSWSQHFQMCHPTHRVQGSGPEWCPEVLSIRRILHRCKKTRALTLRTVRGGHTVVHELPNLGTSPRFNVDQREIGCTTTIDLDWRSKKDLEMSSHDVFSYHPRVACNVRKARLRFKQFCCFSTPINRGGPKQLFYSMSIHDDLDAENADFCVPFHKIRGFWQPMMRSTFAFRVFELKVKEMCMKTLAGNPHIEVFKVLYPAPVFEDGDWGYVCYDAFKKTTSFGRACSAPNWELMATFTNRIVSSCDLGPWSYLEMPEKKPPPTLMGRLEMARRWVVKVWDRPEKLYAPFLQQLPLDKPIWGWIWNLYQCYQQRRVLCMIILLWQSVCFQLSFSSWPFNRSSESPWRDWPFFWLLDIAQQVGIYLGPWWLLSRWDWTEGSKKNGLVEWISTRSVRLVNPASFKELW